VHCDRAQHRRPRAHSRVVGDDGIHRVEVFPVAMIARPFGVVAHEAAHVVVGVALGARLHSAVVRRWYSNGAPCDAWTWFPYADGLTDRLITAAGVAWSNAVGDTHGALDAKALDAKALRLLAPRRADFSAHVVAAAAILESRATAHARVVRALLEHDITHADIERLAHGISPTRLREDDT
jgi:hypothetical protein